MDKSINVKAKEEPIAKKTINARIVADSVNSAGERITSYILTYPRFIHGEVMTHRVFCRNAASSRAIPFNRMVKDVLRDPFIPIAWQKDHTGMQGKEYLEDQEDIDFKRGLWKEASLSAIQAAKDLHMDISIQEMPWELAEVKEETSTTKQLCNRLLEPFQWMTILVTATEFDNFFELRAPSYEIDGKTFKSKKDYLYYKDSVDTTNKFTRPSKLEWLKMSKSPAEIHIQALAEAMWDAHNESTPKELKGGEWHIPFTKYMANMPSSDTLEGLKAIQLKIATARCARLSYMTFEGKIDYDKDIALHDILLEQKHASAFEHCAQAMSEVDRDNYLVIENGKVIEGMCKNYKGFIPYRFKVGL